MALKFEFEGFHLFFWFSTYSLGTLRVTPPVDATNFERVHRAGNRLVKKANSDRKVREVYALILPTIVLTDSVGGRLTRAC